MKVLLLAPPGDKIYLRDSYCSTTSKGDYYWPPSDLLIQSGILKEKFKVYVLDAIAEKLSFEKSFTKINNIKPDAIISLGSSISLKTDMPFLKKVKEAISCKIIMSGDIFFFEPKEMMQRFDFVDALMLNYRTNDIIKFLNKDYGYLKNFYYRKNNKTIITEKIYPQNYKYPPPLLDLFPHKYTHPFMRRKPLASISTSFGCPFKCNFCSQALIPYSYRDLDNIIEELKYLKSKGIKELFIIDFTFNGNLERTKKLLKMMINERLDFTWSCEMVVNNVDEELIRLLKKAGCHTIMFGVESGNDEILKNVKRTTKKKIKQALDICNRFKIRTLAHFIIGFPQDTLETVKETISFSRKIKCTFAVFNLYVPRIGSFARKNIMGEGLNDDLSKLDSSGSCIQSYSNINKDLLIKLRNRAYLKFYLNPMKILNIISSIKTSTEFILFFRNFLKVITKY